MSNKIPCGGFYLSDTLGVDENGKLGVNVDALSGGLIVNLTKDETKGEFTSLLRFYTADKTADEVDAAIGSGRTIQLRADYIAKDGAEKFGIYHLAGFNNGTIAFINVEATIETAYAGKPGIVGYDTIFLNLTSGFWAGSYTDLRNSSVEQTS